MPETNLTALVAEADTVVLADVLSTRTDWAGSGAKRRIATFVRVRVVESVKGSAVGEFELDFTGGTVGDETLRVSGMPQLKPGSRELIFLKANGLQLCPLVSFWHGRLKVWRGTDGTDDRVYRHDGKLVMQLADIGRSREKDAAGPRLENSVQAGMKVSELLGVLRAEVAAQKEGN